MMQLLDIPEKLKEPFSPESHKERKLPGGGTWWFISCQTIRDRLNKVCPEDWTVEYSDPVISADFVVARIVKTASNSFAEVGFSPVAGIH